MIKVLVSAVVGTVVGIAVMVIVIVAAGTTTDNTSSIGEGALPVTTASGGSTSTPSSSGGSTSTGGSTGGSTGSSTGDPANGKTIFTGSAGCAGCHTFAAAGSTGSIGPDLDSLSADAQKAGQPLDQFVMTSIVDPNKYIAQGFQPGVMPDTFDTLSQSDLADLVAFITQNQK